MEPVIKEKWINALRCGKYTQRKTYLNFNNAMCCLGVLCDVYDPTLWKKEKCGCFSYEINNYRDSSGLSQNMLEITGLTDVQQNVLIVMNDDGNKSFLEIADYIEANL